jgi:viroplasmin and RNaseH domain-containing protein
MAPIFNPSGSSSSFDGVEFKFDLINDTREHALNNMNFIYTITGNNKWIQQGVFSSSANLYDVKIPGGQRLFMTKGTFTVAFKGAVRTLSDGNTSDFYFGDNTRIPEAYSISMKFESVLPGNFNTYMLGLIKGNEDLFAHKKREKGIAGKISNAFSLAFKSAEAVSNAATDILNTNITTKAVIEADEIEEVIFDNNNNEEWNNLVSKELNELEQKVDIATQTNFNEKVKDFYTQNPDKELTKTQCDEFLNASKDEALKQYTKEIQELSEKRNKLIVEKSLEDADIDV